MKFNLNVEEPEQISDGVFRTTLSHPLLEGKLSFIHGTTNRDQTLMSLTNSLVDDIKDLVTTFGELTKAKK